MPVPVLHLLRSAQVEETGPARIVASLARGLDREEFQTHVWFLGEAGPLVTDLEAVGATTRCVEWTGKIGNIGGACQFWNSFRGQPFLIVHHHFGGRAIRHIVRMTSKARIIVHLHACLGEVDSRRNEAIAVHNSDVVIAVSHAVANQVKAPRAVVVHSGIDLSGERVSSSSRETTAAIVVGVASRLVDIKGLSDLIQAIAMLSPQFPDLRLEVAGDGPELEKLKQQAGRLGISERIRFLGWCREMGPLYGRWDIFAIPSLTEAFPIAALEAMGHGLPIVATNVGGLPEIVEDGGTGYLIPPKDFTALADRLQTLIRDSSQRKAMGAAGYQRVRDYFSASRMIAQTAEVYRSLLLRM